MQFNTKFIFFLWSLCRLVEGQLLASPTSRIVTPLSQSSFSRPATASSTLRATSIFPSTTSAFISRSSTSRPPPVSSTAPPLSAPTPSNAAVPSTTSMALTTATFPFESSVTATVTTETTETEESVAQSQSSSKDTSNETLKTYSIIVASCCFLIGITFFLYYALSNRAKKRKEMEAGGALDIATTSSLVQGVFFVGGGNDQADAMIKASKDLEGGDKLVHQSCSFEKIPVSPVLSNVSTLSLSTTSPSLSGPSSPPLLSPTPSSNSNTTSSSERYDTFDTHHQYSNQLYVPNGADHRLSVTSRFSMGSQFGSLGRVMGQERQRPFSWQRRDSTALFTTPVGMIDENGQVQDQFQYQY